jgi:hypothetical protein
VKREVGKTVGIYERPAKAKWPRVAAIVAIVVLAIVAAAAALGFFDF